MSQQRDIIRNGLQELSNASESGRNCGVTFEANGKEHWLQCMLTQINMDWPFASPPSESEGLKVCFGSGGPIHIDAWDIDSYVTFTPNVKDVDALIAGIDSTFQNLYDLGADYALNYKVEHCLTSCSPPPLRKVLGERIPQEDFIPPNRFRFPRFIHGEDS